MAKLGSLPEYMRREYQWECSNCDYVFTKKGARGGKCPKCGGTLKECYGPEKLLEKTMGD